MNLLDKELPRLSIGQTVQIIHEPKAGPTISIEATVVKSEHPWYWVDTKEQKEIKIHRKGLIV